MSKLFKALALHGFTGVGEDFAGLTPHCRQISDWRCPDMPGHGSNHGLACDAASTLAFLKAQAASVSRARVLIGYSMGGRAALSLLVDNPSAWDAAILVGVNPGISAQPDREARASEDALLAERIQNEGIPAFLEFWEEHPVIQSQVNIEGPFRERMREARLRQSPEGLAASLRGFSQGVVPDLWQRLSQLAVPILLITGEQDAKYSKIAERFAQMAPNARHDVIKDAGHMAHLEAPSAAGALIDRFLAQFPR